MRIVSCSSHSPDFFSSHPLHSLVVSSEMLPPSENLSRFDPHKDISPFSIVSRKASGVSGGAFTENCLIVWH